MNTKQPHRTQTAQSHEPRRLVAVLRCVIAMVLLTSAALALTMGAAEAQVDYEPPVAAPTFDPPANDAGWHAGDVTVSFNWDDTQWGVGVDPENCTMELTFSAGSRSNCPC